jgi:ABC-type iron transport system FetAB ATPase subunit
VALDAHTSPIADVSYTHDQKCLFSSGSEDEMIIQWRFRYYNEEGSATICRMKEESPSECLND